MGPAPLHPTPTPWAGLDVLVVEDHADSAEALRQMLEATGARVRIARDGAEALGYLQLPPAPQLVLTDLRMPRLDGLQLVSRMRQDVRFARLPVIAVTAYVSRADLHATVEAGFDGHVAKPIDFDLLTATVRRVMAARRSRGRWLRRRSRRRRPNPPEPGG